MPRTAATFTQADIARAIRAAKAEGMRVRLTRGGDLIIESPLESPPTAMDLPPATAERDAGDSGARKPLVF